MLIGSAPKRPSLAAVRRIKRALHDTLALADDATITIAQLACREDACAPLETVVGVLRPSTPRLQGTIHKATDDVVAEDLVRICETWGFHISVPTLHSHWKDR